VDYQFTAEMESQLDEIAEGKQDLEPWLSRFYFGDPSAGTELARLGLEHMTTCNRVRLRRDQFRSFWAPPRRIPVSVRSGANGPYLIHGDDRARYPSAGPDS